LQLDSLTEAGQICQPTGIATVHAPRLQAADRTCRAPRGSLVEDAQRVTVENEMTEPAPRWGTEEIRQQQKEPSMNGQLPG
jgi:hypothetical protein